MCVLLPFAVLILAASQATADTAQTAAARSETQPPAVAAEEQVRDTSDMVDVTDLIRKIRDKPAETETEFDYRKPMRAIAPVIGVKPSSGVIVGVAGNVGFFRGEPATTRISSSVASVTFTSKKQAGINAHTMMFGLGDRWILELDDRFQWTSQETFGLGTGTASAAGEVVRFDFYRLHQLAHFQLRRNLFAGGGLHFDSHADVHPDDDAEGQWTQSAYYQVQRGERTAARYADIRRPKHRDPLGQS